MKKKNKQINVTTPVKNINQPKVKMTVQGDKKTRMLVLVLGLVCIFLYGNTCYNDYCLDDAMVITGNSSTLKGFSGIKEHISQDLLFGFKHIKSKSAASAGWRPLSLITYSIEIGLWGKNKPGYSHAVNTLLYACTVILLFLFLYRYLFKEIWLSFFAALLFAINPIHTEVVANIKGRDEILCLLFMLLSLMQLFKFIALKRSRFLIGSLLLYFLSLTSKENSTTFIAGIPVLLYFFTKPDRKKIFYYTSAYAGIALLYLLIRNSIVPLTGFTSNPEIINNAFLKASGLEGICTKFFVLLIYFRLLVFPYPLSFDYSYNQIPYQNTGNPWVWVSVILIIVLLTIAISRLKRKNIYSFCILLFLITFSISSNFIIDIGMMLGERLLYMPSVFFCIALAVAGKDIVDLLVQKIQIKKSYAVALFIFPLFTASAFDTISRNTDWENEYTLSLADISKSPNSSRVNGGAGAAYLFYSFKDGISKETKDSLLNTSVAYLKKSLYIYPEYNDALLNLGVAYSSLDSLDKAEECWNIVRSRTPGHPKLKIYDSFLANKYINTGMEYGRKNILDTSLYFLEKAIPYCNSDSLKLSCWYNIGGLYFTTGNYQKAYEAFGKVTEINPGYLNAKDGLLQSESFLKNKK